MVQRGGGAVVAVELDQILRALESGVKAVGFISIIECGDDAIDCVISSLYPSESPPYESSLRFLRFVGDRLIEKLKEYDGGGDDTGASELVH
jgi:hypothetical protein